VEPRSKKKDIEHSVRLETKGIARMACAQVRIDAHCVLEFVVVLAKGEKGRIRCGTQIKEERHRTQLKEEV
jgi:hypothetical protein